MQNLVKKMHPFWGTIFAIWCVTWGALEGSVFYWHPRHPEIFQWIWVGMMVSLLVAEVCGIQIKRRKEKRGQQEVGSTLSELVWNFLGEEPAKAGLGAGIAIAFALRATSLPFLFSGYHKEFIFVYGPWLALGSGLLAWLVIHFPNRRKWMVKKMAVQITNMTMEELLRANRLIAEELASRPQSDSATG